MKACSLSLFSRNRVFVSFYINSNDDDRGRAKLFSFVFPFIRYPISILLLFPRPFIGYRRYRRPHLGQMTDPWFTLLFVLEGARNSRNIEEKEGGGEWPRDFFEWRTLNSYRRAEGRRFPLLFSFIWREEILRGGLIFLIYRVVDIKQSIVNFSNRKLLLNY